MEDSTRIFDYMEATECIVAQESTGKSYNRRSSILKPQKPRNPLQDLDFNPTLNDETTVTRKSRRVSFAAGSQVKEFHEVHTEVASVTVWGHSYEQTIVNSGSDSSHHGDHTTQGDCSNITNFDALVTGKIHISERNHHDDFENTPVDLRNRSGLLEIPHSLMQQGNCNNARGNGTGIDDRPLDLTLGTSRPVSSTQKVLSHSRFEGQIISGSMFQSEYSQHSIKTTFYGGDDEMDMSLSMREENNENLIANLFNKTGYVDDQDLSSSNEVFSPNGERVDQRTSNTLHSVPQRQHFDNTVLAGNIDFTEPLAGRIFPQPSNFKTPYTIGQIQQAKLSKPFKSHGVGERDVQQENTEFVSNMDFTEPVGVLFPLRSNYREEVDKTLFGLKKDLTEEANRNTPSRFVEDHDMEISSHRNYQSTHHSRNQSLDKTCYFDEMDMTKPVHASSLESRGCNLDRTSYVEDMDMTRPVKAAMIEQQVGRLNKTAYDDEMEITGPLTVSLFKQQTIQLNKTAFVDDMEMTRPINAGVIDQETVQLNKTAYDDEMEMTRPVNAGVIDQETVQLNKTAFDEEMEMTRPVNAGVIDQETVQLNKTAYDDEMEMTRPVNAGVIDQETVQLNKTAFDEMEMEMTRPVNAGVIDQETVQLNKTVFVEEMDITKPISSALSENYGKLLNINKTTCFDDMFVQKDVGKQPLPETHVQERGKSYSIIEAVESSHCGDLCGSENSHSVIFSEQMATQVESTTNDFYFFDNNDVTEVTCTTFVSPPEIVSTPVTAASYSGERKMPQNDSKYVEETTDFTEANSKTVSILKTFDSPDENQYTSEEVTLKQDIRHACPQNRNLGKQSLNKNVSECSQQSGNSSLDQEQIAKSPELRLSLSCTGSINSDKSLQETLKRLNVLPVPEFFSKPALETKVNALEIVSSELYSKKCLESCSTEFDRLDADKSLVDVSVSGGKEFSHSDEKVQHSDMKRQLQSETPITSEDLCSPPKLICVRTDEEQVLLAEPQCNFKKREMSEVSITDSNVSILSLEGMKDSLDDNEAFILDGEERKMVDSSVSQSFQETSDSHLDLTTDDAEKYNSDKMVTAIAPKVNEPETVEEVIKMLEKRSMEWTILELEESTWTFSFFCETLDLVLRLAPVNGTSEQEVTSIHFTSHRTEKSKDLCHFSHKTLMQAFPVEDMQSMCRSVSDVVNMLNSISNESAKIKLFVDDFVFLQNTYGMMLKDDQHSAYVTVTSYPLFSFTCLTINLENSWESFVSDDIKVDRIVGKTVKPDVIRSFAKGVKPGPHCLKKLFLDIMKYVENMEKFRPPGPLRFD